MLEGFERRGVYALRAVIRISGYLDAAEGFGGYPDAAEGFGGYPDAAEGFGGYPDAAGKPPVCRAGAGNEEMN